MSAATTPGARYGVTSMVAPLKRVLVRRPATAGDWDGAGWRVPEPAALTAQHEAFVTLLGDLGAMAKPIRAKEPGHAAEELQRLDIPVIGTLEGDAYADGGDRFWLDDHTIALGLGYRTNRAGADRLRELLTPEGVHVETYDMPHDQGPDFVLHLQSFLSAVTDELYVIYEPLAPVRLLQDIRERGIAWIAIDQDSYAAMGCNILAVRPGVVVMVDSAPKVRDELSKRGIEVHTYDGSELSLKGDGGPTCLTAPLLRG
jgi:N-dimethylarginine dimethylaminohydrolase